MDGWMDGGYLSRTSVCLSAVCAEPAQNSAHGKMWMWDCPWIPPYSPVKCTCCPLEQLGWPSIIMTRLCCSPLSPPRSQINIQSWEINNVCDRFFIRFHVRRTAGISYWFVDWLCVDDNMSYMTFVLVHFSQNTSVSVGWQKMPHSVDPNTFPHFLLGFLDVSGYDRVLRVYKSAV